MSTQAQVTANQNNSKLSTGPRTEAGKKASSLNAVRHGLTGAHLVLTPDEAARYKEYSEGVLLELRPVGEFESELALSYVNSRFRISQIHTLESGVWALGLRKYADEYAGEIPESMHSLIQARVFEEKQKEFDRLARYEARLTRQANKDLALLRTVQEERKARLASQTKEAIALLQHFEREGQDWNPFKFGFDWSKSEIVEIRDLQNTKIAARVAYRTGAK